MEYLTGKNKEKFEKWYINDYIKIGHANNLEDHRDGMLGDFYCKRFEMQIGVLLAYYDSLWIEIYVYRADIDNKWRLTIYTESGNEYFYGGIIRNEAYKSAFIKANELVNQ